MPFEAVEYFATVGIAVVVLLVWPAKSVGVLMVLASYGCLRALAGLSRSSSGYISFPLDYSFKPPDALCDKDLSLQSVLKS